MRRLFVLVLITFFLLLTSNSSAISSPTNLSPADGSTTSSNTFSWSPVDGATRYRVIIDIDNPPDFPYSASTYKDPPALSTTYSPTTLVLGTNYYWKVGAQDSSNTWFWSNVQLFTFSSSPPTSTPPPASTATPTSTSPTSSPTPTSSPSSTSTPTPTTASESSFTISASQLSINSSNSFSVSVNLINLNPTSHFYLKGAFQKSGSSNYFGQTQVGSTWIKNSSSYSTQLPITTDSIGSYSGNLTIKPDTNDSGFTGTGDYIFKVGRYSDTGAGPTWSNQITVTITETSPSSDISVSSSTITPTPTPTSKSFFSTLASTLGFGDKSSTAKIPDSLTANSEASIAGEATASSQTAEVESVKSNKTPNLLLLASGVAFLVVSGSVFYAWKKYR